MKFHYDDQTRQFHLFNEKISYIMHILPNGHLGNLYFG